MSYTYIKFESQTQAEKAKLLLLKKNISSHIRRNPNPNHRQGCNFALFVDGNIWFAFDIIASNNISNLGVESYRERL